MSRRQNVRTPFRIRMVQRPRSDLKREARDPETTMTEIVPSVPTPDP